MTQPIRVLRYGLTDAGTIYKAGDVVKDPSPALYKLTVEGRLFNGKKLAEFVEQQSVAFVPMVIKESDIEPEPEPEQMMFADQEPVAEKELVGSAPRKGKRK